MLPKILRPVVIAILITLLISDFYSGEYMSGIAVTILAIILSTLYYIDFKINKDK